MNSTEQRPVVIEQAITPADLAHAVLGPEAPAAALAALVENPTLLARTLRSFLVPTNQPVIKLMFGGNEPLPAGVEFLVNKALSRVCAELGLDAEPPGARARLRLRFMKGAKGKEFHRNRDASTNAVLLLEGEEDWYFLPSVPDVDAVFEAFDDPKHCGYRSQHFDKELPTPALLQRVDNLLAESGTDHRIETIKVKAGDVLVFNGHWWHATKHVSNQLSNLQIALNGEEVNQRPMKLADQALLRPAGRYTALLWPAKYVKTTNDR